MATRSCKTDPHRAERSIPFSEEPLLSGGCSMEEKETIEARKWWIAMTFLSVKHGHILGI